MSEQNKFKKSAVIKYSNFGWRNIEGQGYGADIYFDEKEIMNAFKEMHKDNPESQIELYFTVNHANNFVTVMLKCGDKKIRLPKTNVEVSISETMTLKK